MIRYFRCLRHLRKFKKIDSFTLYRALCLYNRSDIKDVERVIFYYDKIPFNRRDRFYNDLVGYTTDSLYPMLDYGHKIYMLFVDRGIKVPDVKVFEHLVDTYIKNKELMEKFEKQTLKNN